MRDGLFNGKQDFKPLLSGQHVCRTNKKFIYLLIVKSIKILTNYMHSIL